MKNTSLVSYIIESKNSVLSSKMFNYWNSRSITRSSRRQFLKNIVPTGCSVSRKKFERIG